MKNPKNWLWFFLFGSLWGINEVVMGEILSQNKVPHFSIFLAAIAVFILAVARGIVNRPGSSTVIGTFAVLFKLANAAPFHCHLLGIFFTGLVFDIFATVLMKKEKTTPIRSSLAGVLSVYSSNALFAVIITYIVRYEYWTKEGLPKVLSHIFVAGTISAVLASVLVPLGFRIGVTSGTLAERQPRWTSAGTAVCVVIIWILARVLS